MESNKDKFLKNPTVHPKTGEKIKIGSKEFVKLAEKYGYPKIKSPKSKTSIAIGKITYNNLIKNKEYTEDYLLSLLNPQIIKTQLTLNNVNIEQLLPNDVLIEIYKNMKTYDKIQFCITNKLFNTLCNNDNHIKTLSHTLGYKKVACGHNNTFIIKDDKLYGVGSNAHGQFGNNKQGKGYGTGTPFHMMIPNNYIPLSVACGSDHTIVLTNDGLYGCGRNNNGQLTGTERHYLTLTKIKHQGIILSIACSSHSTYIVTTEGLFYTNTNTKTFEKILIPNPLYVTCINNIIISVITTSGLYVIKSADYNNFYFLNIDNINDILDVTCNNNTIIVLTTTGLYTSDGKNIKKLSFDMSIKQLSCNNETQYVLTMDGDVYLFGVNMEKIIKNIPQKVKAEKTQLSSIINIVSSSQHTVAVDKYGNYYGQGSNYHVQLNKGGGSNFSNCHFFK